VHESASTGAPSVPMLAPDHADGPPVGFTDITPTLASVTAEQAAADPHEAIAGVPLKDVCTIHAGRASAGSTDVTS